jgi:hypothetical protein
MDHLFRGWLTGGDGYPKKPDPAAFEAALQPRKSDSHGENSVS